MSEAFQLSVTQIQTWQQKDRLVLQPAKAQWSFCGEVNEPILRAAIVAAITEQEVFATDIAQVPGMAQPMQIPSEGIDIVWLDNDVTADDWHEMTLTPHWQTSQAKVCLWWQVTATEIQVNMACHPLHSDALTSAILLQTIAEHYAELSEGHALQREEDDILQYIDASEYTYELWETDEVREGKSFWDKCFSQRVENPALPQASANFPPATDLAQSTDAPAQVSSPTYEQHTLAAIDPPLYAQIQQHVAHFNISTEVWFLAAWQSFISLLMAFKPWELHVTLAGRHDEELELTCGPLAKNVPWTVQIDDSLRFEQLLRQVSHVMDDYQTWFEYVDLGHIDAMNDEDAQRYHFAFSHVAEQQLAGGVTAKVTQTATPISHFWLSLQVLHSVPLDADDTAQISAALRFDTQRFSAESIAIIAAYWQQWLHSLGSDYSQVLASAQLLDQQQQQHILQSFNAVPLHHCATSTVLEGLYQSATQHPTKIALRCAAHQLDYTQLIGLVEAHAEALQAAGIQAGEFVGVCTQRSVLSVVAMLAVFRAGATYVPLDPSYPKERLDYILSHSGTKTVLASPGFSVRFDERIHCIDVDIARQGQGCSPVAIDPQQAAYLIYTSGTTGTPKGTLISHQAFAAHCASVVQYFELSSNDNVLLFAPFNFDPSLEQSVPSLLVGAMVYVREDTVWTLEQVAQYIAQQALTVVNFPTAFWHLLVQHWHENPPEQLTESLRLVISGGDKMLPAMVRLWCELSLGSQPNEHTLHTSHSVRLLNAYGPTETTVTASAADSLFESLQHYQQLPIGRPLPNRRMYLLDEQQQPVPIGAVGELYIAGASISSGYLHDAEKTAERFLADPFAQLFTSNSAQAASSAASKAPEQALMYRTGDRGFYAFDGQIYFVGRNDSQVKIRGYRVEPLEVEQVLTALSDVAEAAVVVREGAQEDDKSLVACVVHKSRELLADSDVVSFTSSLATQLASGLPDYMLPADIVLFERFPLMPNGKLDRQQLAQQLDHKLQRQQQVVLPQTDVEQHLAGIWSDLLKQDTISRDDNFLQLGGHSLVAMRLISRITQEFDVTLSLRDVFAAEDLQQMAECVEQQQPSEQTRITALDRAEFVNSGLALSFSQERIWFLHQLGQFQPYHMPGLLALSGPLNVDAFHMALTAVLQRHESLRMAYKSNESGVAQFPLDVTPEFIQGIYSQASFSDKASFLLAYREWFSQPFMLEQGQVLRLLLANVSGEYFLGVCLHHICTDAMSNNLILTELAQNYAQAVDTGKVAATPLALQYADYAYWQKQLVGEALIASESQYWTAQLQAMRDLEIPTGRVRPEVFTGRGDRLSRQVPAVVGEQLHALSQQQNVTVFSAWLSIAHQFLSLYSNHQHFVMGIPVSERPDPALEQVVGIFLNSLPIYLGETTQQTTVAEQLSHAQRVLLDAQSHQNLPFERLVELLNPARDLARNPIFQVMVNHVTPLQNVQFGDVVAQMELAQDAVVQFDLMFDLEESSTGEFNVVLSYNTDLFDYSMMFRMLDNLMHFMTHFVRDANCPLSTIAFQGPIETALLHQIDINVEGADDSRTQLTPKAANDAVNHDDFANVGDFVKSIVQRSQQMPQAIAVKDGQSSWTYAQLLRSSECIRQQLKAQGVVSGDKVAIALQRNTTLLAGLLAILRLGACYIPLDLKFPANRLRYMLEDSGVQVLLHDHTLTAELQTQLQANICVDVSAPSLKEAMSTALQQDDFATEALGEVEQGHLAYVIYTSGSTGKPKGVMISRQAASVFFHSFSAALPLQATDTFLAMTTISFDVSLIELFMPLQHGACVMLADTELATHADALQQVIDDQQVTVMQATPVTWKMLQMSNWRNPSNLRLLSGGEALSDAAAAYLTDISEFVINAYGPTEATVYTTTKRVQANKNVTIGKPLAGYKLRIVDEHLAECPIGVIGELFIAGPALADGYLNLPERNKESFLQPADHPELTQVNYTTGDLAYFTTDPAFIEDGSSPELCYLSRKDSQVKLRGFRIETGEIETVLMQHQGIDSAIVLLVAEPVAHLVACYTLVDNGHALVDNGDALVDNGDALVDNGDALSSESLKQHLAAMLPSYMLPSDFIALPAMPLTANLKVDRPALLRNVQSGIANEATANPETANTDWSAASSVEQTLADIWQELLGGKAFTKHDDFFAIGGHSLLIVMLHNRIRLALGVPCELQQLFMHRQFSAMAQYIAEQQQASAHQLDVSSEVVDWHIEPDNTPLLAPLSFEQQGLWLDEQLVGTSARFNMVFAVSIEGEPADITPARWLTTLQAIELRHNVLRSQLMFVDGRAVQRVADAPHFAFDVYDLQKGNSKQHASVIDSVTQKELTRHVDLSVDPLWRVHLLQLSDTRLHLVFNMHHACTDGVSMQVLLHEIIALFPQSVSLSEPALLASAGAILPYQYRDFAHWQREFADKGGFASSLAYWQKTLTGLPQYTPLPLDTPREQAPPAKGKLLNTQFDSALPQQIREQAIALDVTPYMLFLTAFTAALYVETGETDICIGSDVANRTQEEVQNLIGFFVNQIPMRNQVNEQHHLLPLLAAVKQQTLQALTHQQVPFEQLVSQLNLPREAGCSPMFQAKFIMEHPEATTHKIGSTTLRVIELDEQPARVDLSLAILDRGEEFSANVVFNCALFRESTVLQFIDTFHSLVHGIVEQSPNTLSQWRQQIQAARKQQQVADKSALLEKKLSGFKKRAPRSTAKSE